MNIKFNRSETIVIKNAKNKIIDKKIFTYSDTFLYKNKYKFDIKISVTDTKIPPQGFFNIIVNRNDFMQKLEYCLDRHRKINKKQTIYISIVDNQYLSISYIS